MGCKTEGVEKQMKTEKFLKQYSVKIDDDACKLCALHEKFNEKVDFIPCPHCDAQLDMERSELAAVGEHNGLDTKNITKCPVLECENCGQTIALIPMVIHYNGNHDVYYTGEPCFMTFEEDEELEKRVAERMKKSVEQFVRRVKEGENNLTEFYLNHWMSRDVSGAVAEFLYEKGYKKSLSSSGALTNKGRAV
jgi:hypothetical protein